MSSTLRASCTRDMTVLLLHWRESMDRPSRIHRPLSIGECWMATATSKSRIRVTEECCPSVLAAPLSEADAATLASGFAALADPVRLRVLSLIAAADEC